MFADLSAELDAEAEAEQRSEVADRIRADLSRLRLVDRLRPALNSGARLRVTVSGHDPVIGTLQALGSEWLLISEDSGDERLIPLSALQRIEGLSQRSAEPGSEGVVASRLGLAIALRRIVRDRSPVAVALTSGDVLVGRLARVGADHVELEPLDGLASSSASIATLPIAALAFVRRR